MARMISLDTLPDGQESREVHSEVAPRRSASQRSRNVERLQLRQSTLSFNALLSFDKLSRASRASSEDSDFPEHLVSSSAHGMQLSSAKARASSTSLFKPSSHTDMSSTPGKAVSPYFVSQPLEQKFKRRCASAPSDQTLEKSYTLPDLGEKWRQRSQKKQKASSKPVLVSMKRTGTIHSSAGNKAIELSQMPAAPLKAEPGTMV